MLDEHTAQPLYRRFLPNRVRACPRHGLSIAHTVESARLLAVGRRRVAAFRHPEPRIWKFGMLDT